MSSKSAEPPKQYTRDEYIFLSKLYWKAELFKEMIKFIKEFTILDPKLNKEERDIICTGFKDMISDKRSSWSILNSMERKEKNKKINTVKEIKIVKNNIEKEIREICNTLQDLIDKFIIPYNDDIETLVFFYKLKADYFRYICEFAEEKEYNDNFSKAEEYYTKGYNLSIKRLNSINLVGKEKDLNLSDYDEKSYKTTGNMININVQNREQENFPKKYIYNFRNN